MVLCPWFCPYYHSFRTLRSGVSVAPFGLCAVLCPSYYHSFRTQHGSVPAVLALLHLYSDSARLCARTSVCITTLFGLTIALCPRFWPYYPSIRTQYRSVPALLSLLPLIRTQRGSVSAVLSEPEPYLDSVELFSLKHCLNQTNLLNKRLFSWVFHSQVLFTFLKRDINGHFGSIIIAVRIGAVRRITFRVIFIILIVVDK